MFYLKMVRFTPRGIYYFIKVLWLSFRWIFHTSLGDRIVYRGTEYTILNGVYQDKWRIKKLGTECYDPLIGDDSWVPRNECRKIKSFGNVIHSFKSGFSFYMGNWYLIWVDQGIDDWMRSLPIWPKK